MKLGTIILSELKVECVIGIYPKERKVKQLLFLDIEVVYNFSEAAHRDDIQHTLDYTQLADEIAHLLRKGKFNLVETAAERCCELIFQRWPEAKSCKLKIKKPAAVPSADYAAVYVERKAEKYEGHKLKAANNSAAF